MKKTISRIAMVMMAAAAIAWFGAVASRVQADESASQTTLTGVVSDAMCGAHHTMQGMSAADCTRMCVKAGSGYALVVSDKVYLLKGASAQLNKYAGQKVTVKGAMKGANFVVASVEPAK